MKGKYAYNKLVHHFSEYGYQYGAYVGNPQDQVYTVDVWDYYPMLGEKHPALLKILQVPDGEHEIYINRVCTYNNGNYLEESVKKPGILINSDNGEYDNNALNGFYHTINGDTLPWFYDEDVIN